jgi:hypothetical protein
VKTQTNAGNNMLPKATPRGIPIKRLVSVEGVGGLNRRFRAMNVKFKQLCANFGYVEIFTKKSSVSYLIIYDKIFDALKNWKYKKISCSPHVK